MSDLIDRSNENKGSLQALYPFLNNTPTNSNSMNKALLDSVTEKMMQHQRVMQTFFTENTQAMVDCAKTMADIFQNEGRLFAMGNGGSSSDASHIAVEFLHPVTTGRPALPAFDLTCDKTLISAIANDVGYQHVFSRQVANLVTNKDMVIAVSTSGNSDNLIRALLQAQKNGAVTIGLVGGEGGEMAKMNLDHCLVVHSDSIHRTQECHVAIYHMLWDLVHTFLADERGGLNKLSKNNASKNNTSKQHT